MFCGNGSGNGNENENGNEYENRLASNAAVFGLLRDPAFRPAVGVALAQLGFSLVNAPTSLVLEVCMDLWDSLARRGRVN